MPASSAVYYDPYGRKSARPAPPAEATIDGTWTVTIKGPTGPMATTLELSLANGTLSGVQSGQGMSSPLLDAKYAGGKIWWIDQITRPMELKVEFSGAVEGNTMTGKAKAGFMGSFISRSLLIR
jgi:2,4-diaminopentanoate dehydrogenase